MTEPGIRPDEFARRRQELMHRMEPDSIAIIPGALQVTRNNDVDFPFRQDSDFWYLTGYTEPDALLVLCRDRQEGQSILFCRPRDPEQEVWNGYRLGVEGVLSELGLDQAWDNAELDEQLPELLSGRASLYSRLGEDPFWDSRLLGWIHEIQGPNRRGQTGPDTYRDLTGLLHEMRLFKSDAEIEQMRQAAAISARAHRAVWAAAADARNEGQLEATFRYHCGWAGAPEMAYPPIVGSGRNACILHYTENNSELTDGDLVLVDAGCEWQGYAADITRTFPVNGRFSPEQRALYELVLRAQKAALAQVYPGNCLRRPHEVVIEQLTQGLVELGLLQGEPDELIESQACREFFMHGTSHWLGMDVHDVGQYKPDGAWRLLRPGMCLTIEPGLYVAADNTRVEARWRGIGIRIEDDVVVTEEGHDNLSADAPTDPDEIERICQG